MPWVKYRNNVCGYEVSAFRWHGRTWELFLLKEARIYIPMMADPYDVCDNCDGWMGDHIAHEDAMGKRHRVCLGDYIIKANDGNLLAIDSSTFKSCFKAVE